MPAMADGGRQVVSAPQAQVVAGDESGLGQARIEVEHASQLGQPNVDVRGIGNGLARFLGNNVTGSQQTGSEQIGASKGSASSLSSTACGNSWVRENIDTHSKPGRVMKGRFLRRRLPVPCQC